MRTASTENPAFVAGLDGLRAVAVLAVLAFHLQLDWASGGFLGVSLFFTLSGYLITQLLLREWASSGRIDIVGFWVRRLRRLMPAAVVVLVAVSVAASAFGRFPSERLRGDLAAAFGYAANWRFASASTSYADLFTSVPSPVLHFWSLAIEEQFYVVFPLVMAGLFALRRRWIAPFGLSVLCAASVAASLLSGSRDVVYYATHTRAAEILVGSLLAFWMPLGGFSDASVRGRLLGSRVANSLVFGAAFAAFAALVVFVDTGDGWLYAGGLASMSLLSSLLIVGVQSPGALRWCAERRVFVRIGALSYGLYLFHWPVFLLVTEESIGWSGWPLHGLRLAVTGAVAAASAAILEQPIRRRRIFGSKKSALAALAGAVAVGVAAIAVVPRTPTPALAGLDAPEGFVDFADGRSELKIAVVGSEPTAVDLVESALADDYVLSVFDETDPRCPIGSTEACAEPSVRIGAAIADHRPDIVVAVLGQLDRDAVASNLAGSNAGTVDSDDAAFFDATRAYVDELGDAASTTPMLVVDLGTADAMTAFARDLALRSTSVSVLAGPTRLEILREVRAIRSAAGGEDDRERIMVIGDSTSYGVSVAIDRLEGDRINVLWAGGQNCPLVEVRAVKWWEGVEFDLERCPTLEGEWTAALDSFRPSVVLIAVSVPEQAEQRYLEDPAWHAPGSETYAAVHDDFVSRFMAAVSERGIDTVILDSPAVHGGSLGGAPFAGAERIAAWNAVISRWAQLWPQVVVVPWAEAMLAYEPTPGSLRGDGVHLLQEDLDGLVARAIIPVLLERLFGGAAGSAVEAESEPIE